jgi:S1-C subfamily serine protease
MLKIPCPHCGLLIDESDKKCFSCGKSIIGVTSPKTPRARVVPRDGQSTSVPPASPVVATPISGRSSVRFGNGGSAQSAPQRSLAWGVRRWPIVCGTIIALMALGGLLLGHGDSDQRIVPENETSTPRVPATNVTIVPSTGSSSATPTFAPNGDDELPDEERSVVMIRVFDGGVECRGASGVVYPTSEYIITNDHVVSASQDCTPDEYEIWLTTDGSRSVRFGFQAELLASDVLSDVGILRVLSTEANIDELVPLKEADDPRIGDEILLYGFPGIAGDSLTVSKGIVSGFINQDGSSWIKTDAAASGGSSGGPALTKDRKLVGIVSQAGSSSNGDIVDCRLVADTNSDGFIDEQDTCVPIGSEFTLLVPLAKIDQLLDTFVE